MDKNKSRTDLLAAGRKKLQQFRQKKDSKGSSSHGRSKKNSSASEKHESDADEASSTGNTAGLKQVREWEVKSQSDSDSGRVDSLVSSGAPDVNVDVVAVDPPIPLTAETRVAETALSHDAGSAVEEGWVDENHIDSSKPYEGESSQSIDDKAARVVPLGNSDIPDSEAKTKHDDAFVSVDVSAPHESFDTMDDITITGETESQDGEKFNCMWNIRGDCGGYNGSSCSGLLGGWVEFLRSIGRFAAGLFFKNRFTFCFCGMNCEDPGPNCIVVHVTRLCPIGIQ